MTRCDLLLEAKLNSQIKFQGEWHKIIFEEHLSDIREIIWITVNVAGRHGLCDAHYWDQISNYQLLSAKI